MQEDPEYYAGVLFLELKKVGSSIGVTVLTTSSFHVYTKVLAHKMYNIKNSASATG